MGPRDTATNLLKLLACTVGAGLAVGLVIVGAVAATVVATAVGTARLVSRARPGQATLTHSATVEPSRVAQFQPATAYRTAA